MGGFKVVDKSSFSFESDLPPSLRHIHPSGVLHASRPASPCTICTEEHTFAWIENALHIESALSLLEQRGFSRSKSIVFIPFSTKRKWLERYPQAAPALECMYNGRCIVHLNWRPYQNALGGMEMEGASNDAAAGEDNYDYDGDGNGKSKDGNDDANIPVISDKHRRRYKDRAANNMFLDNNYIPDAERDELHVEIYNYFSWLHANVSELERKRAAASASADANNDAEPEASEVDNDNNNKKAPGRDRTNKNTGVNVTELESLLEKMESTFLIIPNAKLEAAAAAAEDTTNMQQHPQEGDGEQRSEEGAREQSDEAPEAGEQLTIDEAAAEEAPQKEGGGAPFLEKNLSEALFELVVARERAGKSKRRSRRRKQRDAANPKWVVEEFDVMFQKLVDFKEEHGHCRVPRNPRNPADNEEHQKLGNWVQAIRYRRVNLLREGIEYEEAIPGKRKKILTKQLTAERIDRLDSIGFAWTVAGPKVGWDDRFRELTEYWEANGRWPSQSVGKLGDWVKKQRAYYAKKDKNFMKKKALKLDEIGFEWTPRGNTRLNWDEGFEMLVSVIRNKLRQCCWLYIGITISCLLLVSSPQMEFGRINGHFDVQCPAEEVDRKSNEYLLYNWVESLHRMYRSYKLGRQSGSLTDERILLLIKHGFQFHND